MKDNSLKILLWLYSDNLQQPFVSNYEQLKMAMPQLSAGGLRSLIRHLGEKQLIRTETVFQQTSFNITAHGHDELKRQFPVFWQANREWNGKWSCLVFLKAPKTDDNFRYLRTVLLGEKALQLSRGVYLFPGKFPERVTQLCQELYLGAVTIFSIEQWEFGDERSTIVDNFTLSDVIENYSGISKDINRLLSVKNQQKGSYQTLKNEIASVFDRLFLAVSRDSGLSQRYFSNTISPFALLQKLHSLIE